jgi:hypothetical protein
MKKTKLHLTGIGKDLKESAKKKLEKSDGIPRCDSGLTREQYEDLNIPEDKIPQELKDREKEVELDDEEDFEEIYSLVSIYAEDILLMVTDDLETTIFLRDSDLTISVVETADEIDAYIEYLNLSWFERLKISVSKLFSRKNNK